MDPFSGAVLLMTSHAVKLLVGGSAVSRSVVGDLAGDLLVAFFDRNGTGEQDRHLVEIERKLDLSLNQDFDRPFLSARYALEDAADEMRAGGGTASCERARGYFLDAAAGTRSVLPKVQALLGAALCSLLLARPDAAERHAHEAWKWGFSRFARLIWDFGAADPKRDGRRRDELMLEAQALEPLLQGLRSLRLRLGASPPQTARFHLEGGFDLGQVWRSALHVRTEGTEIRLPGGFEARSHLTWSVSRRWGDSPSATGHISLIHRGEACWAWSTGVRAAQIDRPYPWYRLNERSYHMADLPADDAVLSRPDLVPVNAVVAPGDAVAVAISTVPGKRGGTRWPEITLAFGAPSLETADARTQVPTPGVDRMPR